MPFLVDFFHASVFYFTHFIEERVGVLVAQFKEGSPLSLVKKLIHWSMVGNNSKCKANDFLIRLSLEINTELDIGCHASQQCMKRH